MKIIPKFFLFTSSILCTMFLHSTVVFSQAEQEIEPPIFELTGTRESPASTTDGKVRLVWSHGSISTDETVMHFELQQSQNEDFADYKLVYEGQDLASFISGLPNGTYFFRVRAVNTSSDQSSDWSETLVVTVQHYSLSFAFTLMIIGGIVFLLTILVVVYGTLTVDKEANKTHT